MLRTLKSRNAAITIVAALVAAFISAKLFNSANAWVVIPWGIVAFLAALPAKTKKETLALGGLFGFVVSYAYLWFDDTSSYTLAKIVFLALLIILPSLFGLLCGMVAAWLGWIVTTKIKRKRSLKPMR